MKCRGLPLLAILAALMVGTCLPLLSHESSAQSRPNIVVIVADDLDTGSVKYMSEVNRLLINSGMSFSRFFATTPLCCPSRASILRGQYAHNHGVLRNTGENAGFTAFRDKGDEAVTVATLLKSAGYETALIGKYLNGYAEQGGDATYIPPGWDYWVAGVDHDAYFNFNYVLNVNGELVEHGDRNSDYLTDVISENAVTFIDEAASSHRPFFLYLAPYAPHSPSNPAPRHEGMFAGARAPRTPAFNQRSMRKKPEWVRQSARLSEKRIGRLDDGYAARLETLQAVDEMVSTVMQHLDDRGELESTYVLFLSDNGYFLGEYRQPRGKDAPYDAASRVPLVVRGPGISEGASTGKITLNIDLMPTMLEMAGVSTPGFVDGRSLLPLLRGDGGIWRRSALLEGFGKETESIESGEFPTPAFKALRTPNTLYVEYETGEKELYDLRADPYMLSNVVRNSSEELRRTFAHKLRALSTCAGASCRAIEDAPLLERTPAHN